MKGAALRSRGAAPSGRGRRRSRSGQRRPYLRNHSGGLSGSIGSDSPDGTPKYGVGASVGVGDSAVHRANTMYSASDYTAVTRVIAHHNKRAAAAAAAAQQSAATARLRKRHEPESHGLGVASAMRSFKGAAGDMVWGAGTRRRSKGGSVAGGGGGRERQGKSQPRHGHGRRGSDASDTRRARYNSKRDISSRANRNSDDTSFYFSWSSAGYAYFPKGNRADGLKTGEPDDVPGVTIDRPSFSARLRVWLDESTLGKVRRGRVCGRCIGARVVCA